MAVDVRITPATAQIYAEEIISLIDAGAGAGTVSFYTVGSGRPANAAAAISDQTLLAVCTLSKPCGTAVNGVITLDTITGDSDANATGDPAFARFADSTGVGVIDVDVGTAGSSIALTTGTIVQHMVVEINDGATITVPSS